MLPVEPFVTKTTLESSDQDNFTSEGSSNDVAFKIVDRSRKCRNQTLRKIGKRVWEIG